MERKVRLRAVLKFYGGCIVREPLSGDLKVFRDSELKYFLISGGECDGVVLGKALNKYFNTFTLCFKDVPYANVYSANSSYPLESEVISKALIFGRIKDGFGKPLSSLISEYCAID